MEEKEQEGWVKKKRVKEPEGLEGAPCGDGGLARREAWGAQRERRHFSRWLTLSKRENLDAGPKRVNSKVGRKDKSHGLILIPHTCQNLREGLQINPTGNKEPGCGRKVPPIEPRANAAGSGLSIRGTALEKTTVCGKGGGIPSVLEKTSTKQREVQTKLLSRGLEKRKTTKIR